jgi:hypothetical protein
MYAAVLVSVAISTNNAATEHLLGVRARSPQLTTVQRGWLTPLYASSTPVDDDVDGGVPDTVRVASDYSGSET